MTNYTFITLMADELKNALFVRHIKEQERDVLSHHRGQTLNLAA